MDNTDYTTEIWKTIPFAPSYAASTFGRIKRISGGQGARPLLRKTDLEHTGYLRVRLSENGQRLRVSVHRTILLTFEGEPPTPKHQAAHADNDKLNNRLDNLRWATPRENILDKQIHGTQPTGETQGRSKLKNSDVIAIRASDLTNAEIGRRWGISATNVARIRDRTTWRHI